MADKKGKTGLGWAEAFLPPQPEGSAQTGETPGAPAQAEQPGRDAATTQEPTRPKITAPAARVATKRTKRPQAKAAAVKAPAARAANVPGPGEDKISVIISHEYLAKLEELKREERDRLRGEGEKNWRQRVTITQFVNEALKDYLTKKGRL